MTNYIPITTLTIKVNRLTSTHISIRNKTTVQQINTYHKQKSAINTLTHTHTRAAKRSQGHTHSHITCCEHRAEDMVTEHPLRSTDKGKDKMDFGGLIRILPSLSFSLFTLIQNFSLEMHVLVDNKLESSKAGPVVWNRRQKSWGRTGNGYSQWWKQDICRRWIGWDREQSPGEHPTRERKEWTGFR